jgi:hypothetical protein
MRNIFDQYSEPENRLTHALVCSLAEDNRLLRLFIRMATGAAITIPKQLTIVEQSVPGDLEIREELAEERGLPDAWIHDRNGWCLLIESKVSDSLTKRQLDRHQYTAAIHGFKEIHLLGIVTVRPKRSIDRAHLLLWSEIYQWLMTQYQQSAWARKLAEYLEVAEVKLSEDGYLKEGTLTIFSGIPFNEDEPYNYPQAKRILKLAMSELRERNELQRQLKADLGDLGRKAITGKGRTGVWDYIRIRNADTTEQFTKYPHLTLSIGTERVWAGLVIPHAIKSMYRNRIQELASDDFIDLLRGVNTGLIKALRGAPGSKPWAYAIQRRWPSIKSALIIDARLEYDLRTAFPNTKVHSVKSQPEWVKATYDALANKRSNLELGIGAIFPYRECAITKSKRIIGYVSAAWLATKPLLDIMSEGG